mmetsp:Transcript_39149/g.51212  ORF Transcript_39149/g.51212 Transcript_39149/m.51212 type:complete len:187 (+) Transcript_39149:52-612(+)
MPPKKAPAKKEVAESVANADGVVLGPRNTCEIKILMEAQHEAGHYLKVKYDWISVAPGAEGTEITFPVIDTGYFRDWNLVQIEGEEPIVQEEGDAKAKAAAGKKPAVDPKKGAASKLEDIGDNRARIINYERDCAVEAGSGLEVTEEIAVKLSETVLKLEIFDTNKETQEEQLVETVKIDLSSLLY